MKQSIYELVTEQIIERLDQGIVPWRKPWQTLGREGMPKNLISGKAYRGINLMLLGTAPFESPYWLTFNQAKKLGGSVQKGEKSTAIIFWKMLDVLKDGKKKKVPLLRYFRVFNVDQCSDLDHKRIQALRDENKTEPEPFYELPNAEKIADHYLATEVIEYQCKGGRACYSPALDMIRVPPKESFPVREEYYSTLFHEMGHSTGHKTRLNRGLEKGQFGNHEYSKEELVAEFTAAFLCGVCGFENVTVDNSAAYIKSWVKRLKSEPKWLIEASGKATRAADRILEPVAKKELVQVL